MAAVTSERLPKQSKVSKEAKQRRQSTKSVDSGANNNATPEVPAEQSAGISSNVVAQVHASGANDSIDGTACLQPDLAESHIDDNVEVDPNPNDSFMRDGSDRTQTAIIAHYAVPNAKPSTVDHV